ncbi:MAG: alpha-amylase [Candidatus Lokiarchaeota archaeon]|nr:alpha-amylase [Candidatus Lokiarchaeota archaeon]MBD3342571.1 alpha-amylase [Candidatus Lokiarchaeota archaeon]
MSTIEKKWRKHPNIFEINTWPWLNGLSKKYNRKIHLGNIPDELISQDIELFDAVWLMGVWERSPRGKRLAFEHPDLLRAFKDTLDDFKEEDVVGSPYSVFYYHVASDLGGKEGLKKFQRKLNERNIALILDYVPNHVALDHIWTLEKSDMFIKGTEEDLKNNPDGYFKVNGNIYAHGKDPYFKPWTDTIQINAFSSKAREKAKTILSTIANFCDGVRCDMAMLMTNQVFKKTWGQKVGDPLETEFWVEVINSVRNEYSEFKFIAEVYWDMEWELQQQGFDYCYDKILYDRLIHKDAQSVLSHLKAEWDYQRKLVRFIENHDEERAMKSLNKKKSKAAALLIYTLPGASLTYEGQLKGFKKKVPVQLGRRPIEQSDEELRNFYQNLLSTLNSNRFDNKKWSLCQISPISESNFTNSNLISYQWWKDMEWLLFVINYSDVQSQGHVRIKNITLNNHKWNFNDLLKNRTYSYEGSNLNQHGLYIDLDPWDYHFFDLSKD